MPNESGKGPQDGIAQFTLSEAKGLSTGMWETKPEGAGSPPTVLGTEERERRLKRVNRRQMVLRAVDVEKLIEPDHVARAFFCPKDLYHFRSSQPPLLPSPFTHFMPHYRIVFITATNFLPLVSIAPCADWMAKRSKTKTVPSG